MIKRTEFLERFNVKDITTEVMRDSISEWYNLYYSRNLADDEEDNQRLAPTVTFKIKKAMFGEYEAESDNEDAQNVLEEINRKRKSAVEQALVAGRSWLKPFIENGKIKFNVVTRDNVVIIGCDNDNKVVDIGLEEDTEINGNFYTLFERRRVVDGILNIESRLYVSDNRDTLGRRVPLSTLSKYDGIEDMFDIPLNHIGLIEVRCPQENCIDGSDDPVSVYAKATELIHRINENEHQLSGEFERGESRVFVSSDLLKTDSRGRRKLTDNIFVGVDDDPENVGIQTFSPALRDSSFLVRKMAYLRDIENACGLKRGLLSDVDSQERTATEITSSAGEYNLTIIDFQQMWETAVREAVEVAFELAKIYRVFTATYNNEDIVINWGNGILYDKEKTFAEYLTLYQAGLLKGEIVLAFYFNIKWKDSNDLASIREQYMPDTQALLGGVGQ